MTISTRPGLHHDVVEGQLSLGWIGCTATTRHKKNRHRIVDKQGSRYRNWNNGRYVKQKGRRTRVCCSDNCTRSEVSKVITELSVRSRIQSAPHGNDKEEGQDEVSNEHHAQMEFLSNTIIVINVTT